MYRNFKNGGGIVADSATVHPNAYIGGTCMVLQNARVDENSRLYDNCIVAGESKIVRSQIEGNSIITGKATVIDCLLVGNFLATGDTCVDEIDHNSKWLHYHDRHVSCNDKKIQFEIRNDAISSLIEYYKGLRLNSPSIIDGDIQSNKRKKLIWLLKEKLHTVIFKEEEPTAAEQANELAKKQLEPLRKYLMDKWNKDVSLTDIEKAAETLQKRNELINDIIKSAEFERRVNEIIKDGLFYNPINPIKNRIYGEHWGLDRTPVPGTIKYPTIKYKVSTPVITSGDDINAFRSSSSVSMQDLVETKQSSDDVIHKERMNSMKTPMS